MSQPTENLGPFTLNLSLVLILWPSQSQGRSWEPQGPVSPFGATSAGHQCPLQPFLPFSPFLWLDSSTFSSASLSWGSGSRIPGPEAIFPRLLKPYSSIFSPHPPAFLRLWAWAHGCCYWKPRFARYSQKGTNISPLEFCCFIFVLRLSFYPLTGF